MITEEEIARHYSAALDSVALIEAGKPESMDDEEWADCLERNVAHLNLMLEKDFWTTEDLTPIQNAVAAGEAV